MTTRVLIVDNISANRYMLEILLKGYGLEVTSAENGQDALDKARLNPPDLIVTDILMPVMDGYTLCRQWKSDDTLKHIPFVFYTAAYTESKYEEFALSLGADRFILKPQEPDIFMDMLKEVLEEKYTARQAMNKPLGEEMEFFRRDNEILFNKLEKKMLDLEIANQKLKILEERYRLSFEHVMDVIYTIDTDLNITSISPSVEKILGYKPQDFIGRPASDLGDILAPESFEQAVADLSLLVKGDTMPATVYRFIAKDGTIKYGEVRGSPVMGEGKIIGIISVARDITDRKLAEEKLRKSEEHYRTLFDEALDGICLADAKTGIIFDCNQALAALVCRERAELIGQPQTILHPPQDDKTALSPTFKQHLADKEGQILETQIVTKTGEIREVEIKANLLDIHGRKLLQGLFHDITERKQQKDELLFRNILLHTQQEVSIDGILVVDEKTRILSYNRRFVEMWGLPAKLVEDRDDEPVLQFVTAQMADPPSFFRRVQYLYEHRQETSRDELILADGRFFDRYSAPMFGSDDRYFGRVWYFRDITERKQAEEKLVDTLERLKRAVATTIQVMVSAVESRDPYTAGHQIRSADLARAIATEMGLSQEKIDGIHIAGSIHDIGKLSIPSEILVKPTKLSEIEFSLIKEHARQGFEILKGVESSWPLAEMVYQHHERMDGSGYPRHLKGDGILMEARILAVADVVEAIASHRPYRPALGIDAAIEEIQKNRGILYDPMVADACLKLFLEKGYSLH